MTKIERALVVGVLCTLKKTAWDARFEFSTTLDAKYVCGLEQIILFISNIYFQNFIYIKGLTAVESLQTLTLVYLALYLSSNEGSFLAVGAYGNGATATSFLVFFTLKNFMHIKRCD